MILSALAALTFIFSPQHEEENAKEASLISELAGKGVHLNMQEGWIELSATICQRSDPLEYLIINLPRGKDHEALFACEGVDAQSLNTAMLLLGVEAGSNGKFEELEKPPSREDLEAGKPAHRVIPASGDGFYIQASWQVKNSVGEMETHFYRAEDLVLNLRDQRAYHRGKFIYLGSRFIKPHRDAREMFAADAEGNYVSLCYFVPANHLLTGNDPNADDQYLWYPNIYLLPDLGHPVRLFFSRQPLSAPPPSE
ncbi:MAG TPA: hypothetical protein DDW23_00510 [Planctomycetes bacterium]|nr:hypothetical protein [Planctomycetota bacterium]